MVHPRSRTDARSVSPLPVMPGRWEAARAPEHIARERHMPRFRSLSALVLAAALALAGTAVSAVPAAGQSAPQLTPRVTAAAPGTNLGLDATFDATLAPWTVNGDGAAQAAISTVDPHTGAGSALVTGRTNTWNGLSTDVSTALTSGTAYHLDAWVKMAAGAHAADVRVSLAATLAGKTSYSTITTATAVDASTWRELSATFEMPPADTATLYFETAAGTDPFQIDDVTVHDNAPLPIQTDIPSMKDTVPWPLGVAIDKRETTGLPAELMLKHYSQITPENAGKPIETQPTEGNFTFAELDSLLDFARANKLRFYYHTLVWYAVNPDWLFKHADGTPLTDSPADQAIARDRMKTQIDTVAGHIRTKYGEFGSAGNPVVAVDVVNEAIDENENDGLRRGSWYTILGPSYLDDAFSYASQAFNGGAKNGPVKLMLNDYNTEQPAKRNAMYTVVKQMLARGVPLNGIGHQMHVQLGTSIPQMSAAIDKFEGLGLVQAVTELDVSIQGTVTRANLVDQGYYYRDVFTMLRTHRDLFSVTFWGPYDSRSYNAAGAPLPFDGQLQAKPAYYGIADPAQLPARIRSASAARADIPLDAQATSSPEWNLLPLTPIGGSDSGFSLRWAPDHLTAYVDVRDATDDRAADKVTFFTGAAPVVVPRTGAAGAVVTEVPGGYRVVAQLPEQGLAQAGTVPFDVRITDAAGTTVSWNDEKNTQETDQALGVITLKRPVTSVAAPLAPAPAIDGAIDPEWADAPQVSTDQQVSGTGGASAKVKVLFSDDAVNLLYQVTDPTLDASAGNAYEQDSVEAFVSPTNAKTQVFGPQDGQFRVNFENKQSFGGNVPVIGNRLTSAARIVPGGYLVEMRISLGGKKLGPGSTIGLELQVNDATAGTRTAVRTWADPSGLSYQDTSNWGVAVVKGTVAAPAVQNITAPTITGPGQVGATLTSTPGTWNAPTPTLTYQWTRNGKPISGATSATYRVGPADAGRSVGLTVTANAAGFSPGSATARPITIARVPSTTTGAVNWVFVPSTRPVTFTAVVRAGNSVAATGTVTVYDATRAVATAPLPATGGRVGIPLGRLRSGFHLLTARYSGSDQVAGSVARPVLVFVL